MSFPRYPHYKPSGVEWLGEVPEHWSIKMLKWFSTLQRGHDLTETQQEEGIYPVVTSGGITGKHNIYIVKGPGIVTGRYGSTGRLFYIEDHFWPHNTTLYVSNFHENDVRFAWYALHIIDYSSHSAKSAVPGIDRNDLHVLSMAVPPLDEQANIAAFLDQETAKIDALVAEQQRLIELLKEKRQAVISHAVTKGLDPTVPMKPSGIEWLGDIPAHWEIRRLKHISPFIAVGIVVNPSTFIADEGLPFIYGGDIREGVIDWVNARRISESSSQENGKTKLRSGDLLTVRVGAPGVTAVVPPECDGGNCASVMLIRRGLFNSHWLCYLMNTRIVRFQVEVVQYGAAQEQFNIAHAVNFWMPTPPQTEQDKIVDYLESETEKFDTLTADAERAIELLQERRTALISAAVTGQIDVRQLAQGVAA